jgi:hypothetical protein
MSIGEGMLSFMNELLQTFEVQAALVIRGVGIRGFDYSQMQKTANSEGKLLF